MDILSIRKKKAAEAAPANNEREPPGASSSSLVPSSAPPFSSSSSSVSLSSSPFSMVPSPAPPPPQSPTSSAGQPNSSATMSTPPTPLQPSPAPAPAAIAREAARSARTTLPTPAVADDDPLREFLALYDDDEGAHDFGERSGVVEATERFLSFQLQGESYVASIMDVHEILKVRRLTDVPRAPPAILGVLSKRGVVLPVVDLAVLLGLRAPDRRISSRQRVLVVGSGDRICGLRVDSVAEVVKLQHEQLEPVPPSLGARNAGLLVGLGRVGATMYIVLDLQAVLDSFAVSLGLAPSRRGGAT
jgi:purine-binding chemotaxis protein CheW